MKKLYWIDDKTTDDSRPAPQGANKDKLESKFKVKLVVRDPSLPGAFDKLTKEINVKNTYGIILDYKLMKAGSNGDYGTTWAARLRASIPSIPIVGMSSEPASSIPLLRMGNFLEFYKRDELIGSDAPLGELESLFDGYRKIWKAYSSFSESDSPPCLLSLLQTPDSAQELLASVIPTEYKHDWDEESPHSVTRWIWHIFQGRAGFLFDEMETATYLGLTKEGFAIIQDNKNFMKTRYAGVLACDDRPRWWASNMREAVATIIGGPIFGPVAQSRDELLSALDIKSKDCDAMKSKPHGRDDSSEIPDCVVFMDEESKELGALEKRVAALMKDTIVDDRDSIPQFGFQTPRQFQLATD